MIEEQSVIAWHFVCADRRLRDGTPVEAGKTYRLPQGVSPRLCRRGFHGSMMVFDAMFYALGWVVCRTKHSGEIIFGVDKLVSSERQVLWVYDAAPVFRKLGKQLTVDLFRVWDAPDSVRQWFETENHDNVDQVIEDVRRQRAVASPPVDYGVKPSLETVPYYAATMALRFLCHVAMGGSQDSYFNYYGLFTDWYYCLLGPRRSNAEPDQDIVWLQKQVWKEVSDHLEQELMANRPKEEPINV